MRTGLSQHTSLRQELRVNPRLYQAMDMLYMPMMDLQQHLKQELLANPFLELLEPEEEEAPDQKDAEQEKVEKEKQDEVDWEEILLNGFEVGGTREQYEQLEYTEPVTVETRDLIDHLREQLQMLVLTPRQLLLAEEFLGNINEEGYLAAGLEEILNSVNLLVSGHLAPDSAEDGEPDFDDDEETGDLPVSGLTQSHAPRQRLVSQRLRSYRPTFPRRPLLIHLALPPNPRPLPSRDLRPSTPCRKPKRCSRLSSGWIHREREREIFGSAC